MLKVDADAIFMPIRMRVWSKQDLLVPPAEIYLENFKYVDYGYFGKFVSRSSGPLHIYRQHRFVQDEPQLEDAIMDGSTAPLGESVRADMSEQRLRPTQECLRHYDRTRLPS